MKTQHFPVGQKKEATGEKGFALMVTLILMILLTLLAVGMLSLSSIALRNTAQSSDLSEARTNARMALMIAIGRLQEELGPDQRINAKAELIHSDVDASRASWLGVWASWPGGQKDRPSPVFKSWLVSGDPAMMTNPAFPTTTQGKLVNLGNPKSTKAISVPLQPLPKGGIAYWISDENSKARLGPAFAPRNEDLASHLGRWGSPPAASHQIFNGLSEIARDDKRLDQMISTKSLELISANPIASFDEASYTVWSEGLLTNVRDGGFRNDLSLHLSDPTSANAANALYESSAGRGGINFRELANFQNVWTKLTYASSFQHSDGKPLNLSIPTLAGAADRIATTTDPYFSYLRPMVLRGSWHISVMTRESSPVQDPPKYNLYIVLEPVITLWNPYDVNLVMQPGGHLTMRCWGLPYDFDITAAGTSKTVFFNEISGNNQNISMEIGKSEVVTMRPGEVQIFSRGQSATVAANFSGRFEGKPGWVGTGGFAIDTKIAMEKNEPISVGMKASNSRRGGKSFGLIQFHQYVGTDADNSASINWNGGLLIDRSGWSGEIKVDEFPSGSFADIPPVQFGSATEILEERKQPIALFSYRARTEAQVSGSSHGGRFLARLNPATGGYDHQATDGNTLFSLPYEPIMEPLTGGLDRSFDVFDGKGFFGASYRADLGQSHIVTNSIPREPPISLAAFQHANANGVENWIYGSSNSFHDRILQPPISHAIGNSYAPPSIAPNATEGTFNSMDAVDHSWLANDALWDNWFVSSLATRDSPYQDADQKGTPAVLFDRFTGKSGTASPLPNQSYRYAGSDPATDAEKLFSGSSPKETAYQEIASLLKIHGAFNVNSTDPVAWRALFASTAKLRIPVESAIERKTTWENSKNGIAALLIPTGSAVKTDDLTDASNPDQWLGFRDLTDDEVGELADAMVAEVKLRGPFLSISDFINRRVGDDVDLAAKGALQAALDKSVNKSLETGLRASGSAADTAFPGAEQGSKMTHVPGHVEQADVLTSIGSLVQVRGDTFTIRAYGEAHDNAGRVKATACCEAVVRREAAWVDPVDDMITKPGNLSSSANKTFGRKFTQLSFRWLSADKT